MIEKEIENCLLKTLEKNLLIFVGIEICKSIMDVDEEDLNLFFIQREFDEKGLGFNLTNKEIKEQ
jgi:hypothetical protein